MTNLPVLAAVGKKFFKTKKPTVVPAVPRAPTTIDPELRKYLESIQEALEIRLGRRGDPDDRAITLRELVDSGLAKRLTALPYDPDSPGSDFSGAGPEPDLSTPPVPVNFVATAAYSSVVLTWSMPVYPNHALTEIWAYDSDTIGDAQLIGVTSGRAYTDQVGSGVTKYYWIRFVSKAAVPGAFNNSSGTVATTATDVAHQLDVLAGAITSSELATSLAGPISNLPADTVSTIANLQTQINTLSNVAAWASGTAYSANDLVTYSGKLYEAQSAHTASSSNQPSGTTASNSTWTFVGEYDSLASAVAGNTSDITEINFISSTSTSAAAQKLASLDATVTDSTTGLVATRATLLNDYSTTANMNSAISSATTGLASTTFVNNELSNYTNTSTLENNFYTKTQTDSAISSGTSQFRTATQVQDAIDSSLTAYTSTASLTQNYYTQTATDSAISSAITTSQSGFANPDGSSSTVTLQQALTTQANINGDLEGQYSVKIDNNGHITGFGLSSTTTTAGPTSAFIVRADKFAVIDPADTGDGLGTTTPSTDNVPFFIESGNTFIKSAMIKDGTITNAKIGNLAADKITSGFISGDRFEANSIDVQKISMVGTGVNIDLRSSASGARMEIRSSNIQVFDASGALRVKFGDL